MFSQDAEAGRAVHRKAWMSGKGGPHLRMSMRGIVVVADEEPPCLFVFRG